MLYSCKEAWIDGGQCVWTCKSHLWGPTARVATGQNLEIMKHCEMLGLKNSSNLIVGFPGSDAKDVAENKAVENGLPENLALENGVPVNEVIQN
mgnify:CR=1 FL=1